MHVTLNLHLKSSLSGKLIVMEISHFVRNDIQLFKSKRGGWLAALPPTNPLSIQKNEKTCHSERSPQKNGA
jgi:hypothetical protein